MPLPTTNNVIFAIDFERIGHRLEMKEFITKLWSLDHKRWVYFLPGLHLCAYVMSYLGMIIPRLQFIGIIQSFVLLADLPISILAYVLAFHYTELAALWILVGGTLWWYLLSCLAQHLWGS